MATYIALVRKEEGTTYGVDFPDFPGCVSAGESLDAALRSAQEALGLHIEGMLEGGEAVPEPSTLDAVLEDSHNREAYPLLVQVDTKPRRAKRINVTVDEGLLERIDRAASDRGTTRSGFFAEAARRLIEERM